MSLAGNRRVTWELCIWQTGSTIKKLVGSDCERREKIVATSSGDNVVLVHTIATYADCADKNTVAVKTKRTRKNGYSIRQTWIRRTARKCNRARVAVIAGEAGKHLLLPVERALQIAVDARRIIALRKETDTAHRHGHSQP